MLLVFGEGFDLGEGEDHQGFWRWWCAVHFIGCVAVFFDLLATRLRGCGTLVEDLFEGQNDRVDDLREMVQVSLVLCRVIRGCLADVLGLGRRLILHVQKSEEIKRYREDGLGVALTLQLKFDELQVFVEDLLILGAVVHLFGVHHPDDIVLSIQIIQLTRLGHVFRR